MAKKKITIAALVTKKNGDVHQVYRTKRGGFTLSNKRWVGERFLPSKKDELRHWAHKRKYKIEFTRKTNPFVVYDTVTSDGDEKTGRVNRNLEDKLNAAGKKLKRKLFVGEGKRSAHAQWVFYMAMLNGYGNTAARCCTKYGSGVKHSWENCGKNSQSNHYWGGAADTVVMPSWTNIGQYSGGVAALKSVGLGLPVSGEAWHVEITNSFNGV